MVVLVGRWQRLLAQGRLLCAASPAGWRTSPLRFAPSAWP